MSEKQMTMFKTKAFQWDARLQYKNEPYKNYQWLQFRRLCTLCVRDRRIKCYITYNSRAAIYWLKMFQMETSLKYQCIRVAYSHVKKYVNFAREPLRLSFDECQKKIKYFFLLQYILLSD